MTDSNRDEDLDAEGIPEAQDRPPGIDVELDQESTMAPREHSVAAGSDPAYPVTPAEERRRETVAERARRETPDVGAEELGVGGGIAGQAARGSDTGEGEQLAEPDTGEGPEPLGRAVDDPSSSPDPEERAVRIEDDDEITEET